MTAKNNFDRYYVIFHPSAYELMDLMEIEGIAMEGILSFLTGLEARDLNEKNYLDFLRFKPEKKRSSVLEYFGMENYSAYYVANQIARADPKSEIIIADSHRRNIQEVISEKGRKPLAVFITCISSSFPTAAALTIPLNHAKIPVILGGIHVSSSPEDVDRFIKPNVPDPSIVAITRGAGDYRVIEEITSDLMGNSLKPEYFGTATIEDGVWGSPRVRELPGMELNFLKKLPVVGPFLSPRARIRVTTPYLGCPYSCSFCSISTIHRNSRRFTSRSPEDFLAELENFQINGPGLDNRFFFFLPDNLLLGGKKLETMLDMIIESGLKLNYAAQVSIEVAHDTALLKKLRLSGASHFFIGFESLDIRNLEHIGKHSAKLIKKSGITVREYYSSCIKKITNHGISIHGAFIIGLPHDYFHSWNDNTGRDIAEFCIKNKIGVQPASLTALPGSIDFNNAMEDGSFFYGGKNTMEYFLSLCITDLSEMNLAPPPSLGKSPLLVARMVYELARKVGSKKNVLSSAFHMGAKAWKRPTRAGSRNFHDRAIDALAGIVFQLGASTYMDLGNDLVHSNNKIRGIFQRLYDMENK